MAQDEQKVWFITGCSTGFGRELAQQVIARGWRAVVTARKPEQIQELAKGHEGDVLVLPLDVNDAGQVESAVRMAEERFGRIDVLVNNAGYGYMAAIEEGEEDAVRAMFDTNFFGLVRLTNRVLPGMRARRSGTIVNISSIGGLTSFAGTGYYHATKYAVEGMSESLAIETRPLGIKVLIVEPGPFRTDWLGRSLVQSKTVIADYDSTAGERRRRREGRIGRAEGDPVRGCEAIIKAVTSDNPPLRLLLGKSAMALAQQKLEALRQDFEGWKDTTLGADFPEGS